MKKSSVVLKFGRSALQTENDRARAVHEIYRYWRRGNRVIAVASTAGRLQEALIRAGLDPSVLDDTIVVVPTSPDRPDYVRVKNTNGLYDKAGPPLRVALLGCGTVGGGVYDRLSALPRSFTVTGVGTRTGVRARSLGVPEDLITTDLEELVNTPCDVVVELIGGSDRATTLIARALKLGRNVVTANKAAIATHGDALESLAEANGVALRYSAAVGGVLPALETIERAKKTGPIKEFSGVLNGTCNFILDRLATGESMSAAVRKAQEMGYAEACPDIDLNGTDAAQKLILLARAAFDVSLPLAAIARKGIDGLGPADLEAARKCDLSVRLVARCRRSAYGIEASVGPVALPFDHPLAQVRGAENRLLVQPKIGERIVVSGTGAGRWPTTEAVMADIFDMKELTKPTMPVTDPFVTQRRSYDSPQTS